MPILDVPAIIFDYALSEKTNLQITANGIWGERSSVQFINTPNVNDTINTNLGNTKNIDLKLFSSLAYTHARYISGTLINNSDNISLAGNRVEGVPDWIERAGLESRYKKISTTFQSSYVSDQFNDANNTSSSTTGVVGHVPSYNLFDWALN